MSHANNFLFSFLFRKQFTVRGSQCFKEWSPWCWMVWSGSRPACLPLPFICLPVLFICLPGWVWVIVVVGACGRVPGWLVSHFLSFVSHFFSSSPRLGACGRVPGRLVSHFLSFVSHFFSFVSQLGACGRVPGWLVSHFLSFVSQARCLWSGSRPACLPLPFICLPLPFRLGACGRVPGWLVSHFLSFVSHFFSFVSQLGACSRVSGRLVSHFLSCVSHFFPKQFTVRGSQFFLKTCPPFVSLLVSAHFHWPCSISIHLSPRSAASLAKHDPNPQAGVAILM